MKKEYINMLIQKYAHDYRDMKLTENELMELLDNFVDEL